MSTFGDCALNHVHETVRNIVPPWVGSRLIKTIPSFPMMGYCAIFGNFTLEALNMHIGSLDRQIEGWNNGSLTK